MFVEWLKIVIFKTRITIYQNYRHFKFSDLVVLIASNVEIFNIILKIISNFDFLFCWTYSEIYVK